MRFLDKQRFCYFLLVGALVLLTYSSSHALLKSVQINGKPYLLIDDIKSSYQFTSLERRGDEVILSKKRRRVNLRVGSKEMKINTLKFILSNAVIQRKGKLFISEIDVVKVLDPIMRPTHIKNAKKFRTVIIDPGHGGADSGARNQYGTEADYNLIVAKKVGLRLQRMNFRVILTRESDKFLSLKERVDFANHYKDAIFVSIHFNSSHNRGASGIETFTLSPVGVAHYGSKVKSSDYQRKKGNKQDSANIALASSIHTQMITLTAGAKILDRGIKRARFNVLSNVKHPAVLVEGGFMSNPKEAKWIHQERYQNTLALAIAKGVYNLKKALNAQ